MERNEARLAELALPDGEHAGGQSTSSRVEMARLGQPQSGRDQQRKERDVCPRAKPAARRQKARLLQDRGDLGLAVDVRRFVARETAQKTGRRDLGRGIEQRTGTRANGEPPTDAA